MSAFLPKTHLSLISWHLLTINIATFDRSYYWSSLPMPISGKWSFRFNNNLKPIVKWCWTWHKGSEWKLVNRGKTLKVPRTVPCVPKGHGQTHLSFLVQIFNKLQYAHYAISRWDTTSSSIDEETHVTWTKTYM